jgi:hypothetical protein
MEGRLGDEVVSTATLVVGPVGAGAGSPGSPQGASPRQGPGAWSAPRWEDAGLGAGVACRDADERPQQQESPRQAERHLQTRAWASASKWGVETASARATPPQHHSASATTSRRLLRFDRACRGRECMP